MNFQMVQFTLYPVNFYKVFFKFDTHNNCWCFLGSMAADPTQIMAAQALMARMIAAQQQQQQQQGLGSNSGGDVTAMQAMMQARMAAAQQQAAGGHSGGDGAAAQNLMAQMMAAQQQAGGANSGAALMPQQQLLMQQLIMRQAAAAAAAAGPDQAQHGASDSHGESTQNGQHGAGHGMGMMPQGQGHGHGHGHSHGGHGHSHGGQGHKEMAETEMMMALHAQMTFMQNKHKKDNLSKGYILQDPNASQGPRESYLHGGGHYTPPIFGWGPLAKDFVDPQQIHQDHAEGKPAPAPAASMNEKLALMMAGSAGAPLNNVWLFTLPLLGRLRIVKDKAGLIQASVVLFYWIYGNFTTWNVILLPQYYDGRMSVLLMLCK